MNRWLLIDSNYLCWRAHHTVGMLDNGVTFGFLKDLRYLMDQFATSKVAFCFDIGRSKRVKLYPDYKRRGIRTDAEQITHHKVGCEINLIRNEHLPFLGFKNIFWQEGYEADDLIASIIQNREWQEEYEMCGPDSKWIKTQVPEVVIISSDADLFQLLDENVSIYNPTKKELLTEQLFSKRYGITPKQWPMVKAIAGCKSDTIQGVRGVGEKTAIKYLCTYGSIDKEGKGENGEYKLLPHIRSKAFQKIEEDWDDGIADRLKLVKLPFPGVQPCLLVDDKVSEKQWRALNERMGFKSLEKERSK